MNRAIATCWIFLLLSAFLFDQVMSKGGRGGARGSARGSARSSARGGRSSRTGGSSSVRVAGAAAAGAAVALGAGGWYASAQRPPDDSSERGEDYYNNRTDWELYSARTSSAMAHHFTYKNWFANFDRELGWLGQTIDLNSIRHLENALECQK